MRAIYILAGAIYRACSPLSRVSRLSGRYASQIAQAGAHISASWLERQARLTSLSTCAVAIAAPCALLATIFTPDLTLASRLIGAALVIAFSYQLITADCGKVLAIRKHLESQP